MACPRWALRGCPAEKHGRGVAVPNDFVSSRKFSLEHFRQIELFVQIAESGSLSKAAEELKLSVSAASRYLFELERRLGVRLIQRNTRQMFLTEAGIEFRQRCISILADMREAEEMIQDIVVRPRGVLRVT